MTHPHHHHPSITPARFYFSKIIFTKPLLNNSPKQKNSLFATSLVDRGRKLRGVLSGTVRSFKGPQETKIGQINCFSGGPRY